MKRILTLTLAVVFCLGVCACAAKKPAESEVDVPQRQTETGDAAKKAILVVSFGTSYNETRAVTIEAIESAITKAFPEFDVRRAFTSQIIIDKLKTRDGLEIDNVTQAMERLIDEGYGTLVVQPTHVMNGYEYDEMVDAIEPYRDSFSQLVYGKPLLSDEADYDSMVKILTDETAQYNTEVTPRDTAIVFMGHGTEHPANDTYALLQQKLLDAGFENYLVGTVEAEPNLEDVMDAAKSLGVSKVVLLPLMIVAGDHASNDMAGDEEGSWKTEFKGEGFEVECVLKGLGEYPAVQEMFVSHARAAVEELSK